MTKVVINRTYGGFSLSDEALKLLDIEEDYFPRNNDFLRADPKLVAVVEQLGPRASGSFADLRIVEVPDNVKWRIEEYDGLEWVAEVHRVWTGSP